MKATIVTDIFSVIADTPEEAENLRIRADLMNKVIDLVEENKWTLQQAANKCRLTQTRMKDLLQGKIDKFSIDALVAIHTALGKRVEISFKKIEQEEIFA